MKPTHTLREHQDELRLKVQNFEQVLATLPHLSRPELERAVREQILFLREDVKSHAAAEEASLYPELNALAGNPAFSATATMEIDHEFIAGYIERLAEMRLDISPRKIGEFQRVGWELAAILKLHFDKEERVYLPLLDSRLTEKEVQTRIVEKMDVFEEAKWSE
jgi:iron-sulfur cluster repair protein YtfE (RIC family)